MSDYIPRDADYDLSRVLCGVDLFRGHSEDDWRLAEFQAKRRAQEMVGSEKFKECSVVRAARQFTFVVDVLLPEGEAYSEIVR